MASTDAIIGLSIIIVPIVILAAGLVALRFMPSKKRVISLLLVLVGGISTAFYAIGFFALLTREFSAGLIGLGLMIAIGLATLVVGLVNLRKKPAAKNVAVQQTA
ncbi:MAG: hypothetical protein ACQCN5_11410 [Candidatus Bathyarchaeia archaeon]|jgi:uncharacterized membrane protein (UPF0136 family)